MNTRRYKLWDRVESRFIDVIKLGFYDDESLFWYAESSENEIYFSEELGRSWDLLEVTNEGTDNSVEVHEDRIKVNDKGQVVLSISESLSYTVVDRSFYVNQDHDELFR